MDAPSTFKSSNSISQILLTVTFLFSDSLSLSSSSTLKISFGYIHPTQIFWNFLPSLGRLRALILSETLIPICHAAQHSHKLQRREGGIFKGAVILPATEVRGYFRYSGLRRGLLWNVTLRRGYNCKEKEVQRLRGRKELEPSQYWKEASNGPGRVLQSHGQGKGNPRWMWSGKNVLTHVES